MAKRRKPSVCRNTKDGSCSGRYELFYDNVAPYFVCDMCGDKDTTWVKFYSEYLGLFKEKANWLAEKHKISCILGFFCYMYKEKYGVDYTFVPSNPNPYSSKECKDARKLLVSFSNDAEMARKYVYWIFKKATRESTNIVSLAYLNTPALIRKFKLKTEKSKSLTRATKIPKDLYKWCEDNTPSILGSYELSTLNDLGALLGHVKFYNIGPESDEAKVIKQAERFNLIKNGKLNIKE